MDLLLLKYGLISGFDVEFVSLGPKTSTCEIGINITPNQDQVPTYLWNHMQCRQTYNVTGYVTLPLEPQWSTPLHSF